MSVRCLRTGCGLQSKCSPGSLPSLGAPDVSCVEPSTSALEVPHLYKGVQVRSVNGKALAGWMAENDLILGITTHKTKRVKKVWPLYVLGDQILSVKDFIYRERWGTHDWPGSRLRLLRTFAKINKELAPCRNGEIAGNHQVKPSGEQGGASNHQAYRKYPAGSDLTRWRKDPAFIYGHERKQQGYANVKSSQTKRGGSVRTWVPVCYLKRPLLNPVMWLSGLPKHAPLRVGTHHEECVIWQDSWFPVTSRSWEMPSGYLLAGASSVTDSGVRHLWGP